MQKKVRSTFSPLLAPSSLPVQPTWRSTSALPCNNYTMNSMQLSFDHPYLSCSPVPLPRSAPTASIDRTSPPLRIFHCHDSDLTLEVFAAQVGSYQGNRARDIETFAASRSQNRITDTVVVRERKNLKPSRAKEQARRTSHQNTVSGQRPCGCSSTEPRSIPFSETHT